MHNIPATTYDLFNALDTGGVLYCHWKSNEHLIEGLIGKTDLDILVAVQDTAVARNILATQGWILSKWRYRSMTGNNMRRQNLALT